MISREQDFLSYCEFIGEFVHWSDGDVDLSCEELRQITSQFTPTTEEC